MESSADYYCYYYYCHDCLVHVVVPLASLANYYRKKVVC
jgi:hypothetical protein